MQSYPNRIRHRVCFFQHLIVPKPKDPETCLMQSLIADAIPQAVLMLSTIHLDNQARFQTNEIKHEIHEWMLATELEPRHLPPTQALPQAFLGICHIAAQLALKPVVDDGTVGLSLHWNSTLDQCGYSLPFKGRAGVGMG